MDTISHSCLRAAQYHNSFPEISLFVPHTDGKSNYVKSSRLCFRVSRNYSISPALDRSEWLKYFLYNGSSFFLSTSRYFDCVITNIILFTFFIIFHQFKEIILLQERILEGQYQCCKDPGNPFLSFTLPPRNVNVQKSTFLSFPHQFSFFLVFKFLHLQSSYLLVIVPFVKKKIGDHNDHYILQKLKPRW